MSDRVVSACLLIIGNEILSGRTQDKNLAVIAERLNGWGVRLSEARVIPDVPETIIETLNEVRRRFDYVLTTGGIGPTHDDITSECVARAFGLEHQPHPEATRILEAHYGPGQLNEARRRMTMTPAGARLIENPISAAPGFQVENVFVLAGIPRVMRAMLDGLDGRLTGGSPRRSRSAKVHLPEGVLAAELGRLQDAAPSIEIGSYPFHEEGRYGARVVLSGTDEALLFDVAARLEAVLDRLRGDYHWEEG
jgi:molybdenum cofactor synthesis domain-containing protein